MPKHKDQRVGVFVDIQNMYYSAKQFYRLKVNFAHILNRAVAGRQLVRAIAYVIKADIKEEENFFEALEKIGYDVRSKDLQTFFGGAKKGDWDVGIAMDIMRMASKLDVVVLVSGDGDFKDLLEHVKALGCRAEVIAFRKTASSRILAEADEFIDLDKELDKVLIKDTRAPRMGPKPEFGVKKPFEKREFVKKDFTPGFSSETSLLQRVNMEQPTLGVNAHPVHEDQFEHDSGVHSIEHHEHHEHNHEDIHEDHHYEEQAQQPVNRPAPAFNRPAPSMNRPSPVFNRPAPVMNKAPPVFNRPAPAINRPVPTMNRPAPVINKAAPPILNKPVVNKAPNVLMQKPTAMKPAVADKKEPAKKKTIKKEKQDSMLKKVISKMTKKKE